MTLSLYYQDTCPFCQWVLPKIDATGVQVELRNIDLEPAFRAELIREGGKAQVPCLKIERRGEEDVWLYESADIVTWMKEVATNRVGCR